MSFGRWLLIHSFSIFIVGVFLLGYVYRAELQLDEIYSQLLHQQKPVAEHSGAVTEESTSVDNGLPTDSVTEEASVAEIAVVDSSGSEPSISDPGIGNKSASTDIVQPSSVPGPLVDQSDLLYKARRAYWDKDYEMAIFFYQQLIEKDGDNPDYIGELGNIYYSLNDFDNASQQFYQAAIILIARGKPDEAGLLLSPVTAMNRQLGDELRQRIRQTQ